MSSRDHDPGAATGELAACAAERLRRLASSVAGRRPLLAEAVQFDLAWLADGKFLSAMDAELKAKARRGTCSIYEFVAPDEAIYGLLGAAYERRPVTRASDGKRLQYSRSMDPVRPRALYVGSGRDLPGRIGQHLGRIGGAGTYCMRMALWASGVEGALELRYWTYAPDMNPIELEALEQELWDARTPLLGKRSGR